VHEAVETTWRTVTVDGAAVRVMEVCQPSARDADPLLFLHGWGLSPATYKDGIQQLTSAGIRVIAPALPGFSGSDGPPLRAIDMPAYGKRVGRLLDVLGIEKPVFVVGHSFGGGVAIALAAERPERVRSLTLVSSVGGAPGKRSGLVSKSWLRWAMGSITELSPKELTRSAPGMIRALVPNALRKPITMALTAKLALTVDLADEASDLVASGLPVLFVWGDGDRLILPGALGAVAGSLPAEVVVGRHGWLLTEPEQFATLLRNALTVHAMLERTQRGQTMVLPLGRKLADLIPTERRTIGSRAPKRPRRAGDAAGHEGSSVQSSLW
jgi:pimeloyl-ACP methyl ester carboxylesterase